MRNVTDFADNATLFFNQDLPTEFRQGKSWAYGAEFMLNKTREELPALQAIPGRRQYDRYLMSISENI